MFDIHVKSGSPNVAQWFAEPWARAGTLDDACAIVRTLLDEESGNGTNAGVRDAVILGPDCAYLETGARCRTPYALAYALKLDDADV